MGRAYDPVVTPEGLRWRDYELAADLPGPADAGHSEDGLDWFDRGDRPPPLDRVRPYGVPGGLARPDPQDQHDLAQAVRNRFTDPRSGWGRLLNGGGASTDPFRAGNALDCALSAMATWHGEPTVAAPRRPEYTRCGHPVATGESGSVARAQRWLGQRFDFTGHVSKAMARIAGLLVKGGHGAAAILINRWPAGGCHAWNGFCAGSEIVWADLQSGVWGEEPLYPGAAGVFAVVVDHGGRKL